MTIKRHPVPENLMSCAAGSMPEALAAVMACHMTMCSRCQKELTFLSEVGGALLEDMQPETPHAPASAPVSGRSAPSRVSLAPSGDVPEPLKKFVGPSLANVQWRRAASGVWFHPIPLSKHSNASLRLVKVAPGVALPDHGHSGSELTLVLQGAFTDEFGRYDIGDIVEMDDGAEHSPVAAPGADCICLVATEGRLRFQGILARIVQRFTGL